MKITDMFDSSGTVVKANTSQIQFMPQNERINGLNKLRVILLPALIPYDANERTFDLMLQPCGFEDRLLWFSKLRLEGDSDLVKQSQNAVKNPDFVYQNEEQKALFHSVFSAFEKGKTNWYLLNAETICLTRNMYDMKFIKAEREAPLPFYSFIERSKTNRISKEELILKEITDKIQYLAPNKDYSDVRFVIQTALPRAEGDKLDGYIAAGLHKFQERELEGCDEYSNDKTYALMLLNDCRLDKGEQFPIYQELRTWVKRNPMLRGTSVSSYRENFIRLVSGDNMAEIYICGHPVHGTPVFQVNGTILNGMDEIKAFIENGKCFDAPPPWWQTVTGMNRMSDKARKK